jgi:TRAP-type C4-dicarboxylate transport system substrate-binding protein
LQPALSTGAVDGQENPINLFLAFKMDTLAQKHLTIWNYCADAGLFHVAKPVWDTFSKADQEIITESAREAGKRQMASARKGIGVDGDTSSLEEVKKRGVEIADLTRDEKAVFAKTTRPVFDKWAATIGADLVKKAEAAIAKTA